MKGLLRFSGLLMVMALGLAACAHNNALANAETVEQKAFALYGTYVVFQGKAAELKEDSSTPVQVRKSLSQADAVAYPVAEQMIEAVVSVGQIREILTKCQAGPPAVADSRDCDIARTQLENAILHLSEIYFIAQPRLLALVAAVKGAK